MMRGSMSCIIQDANSLSDWGDACVMASAGEKRDQQGNSMGMGMIRRGVNKWKIFNGRGIGGIYIGPGVTFQQ